MVQATASVVQAALARVAQAEAVLFKVGQQLQAVVLGTSADGLTAIKVGDLVVKAELPQPLPPGATLTLQVKSAGGTPQLVVMNQSAPQPSAPPVPMPQMALEMLPEVTVQSKIAPPNQPSVPESSRPVAAPLAAVNAAPPPALSVEPPLAAVIVRAAPTVQPEQGGPQAQQNQPLATPPVRGSGTPATPATDTLPSPVAPSTTNEPVGRMVVPAAQQAASPQPQAATMTARQQPGPQPAVQAAPQTVQPAPVAPAPGQPQAAAPALTAASLLPTSTPEPGVVPAAPATLAVPAQTSSVPASLAPAATSQPAPVSQAVAGSTGQATPPPASSPAATAEPPAASPLLVAQTTARAPASMAEMPQPPQVVVVPQTSVPPPVPQQAPPPPTPQAALAQMLPAALAKQDSVGPLLQSLAAVVAKAVPLPQPVLKAALHVLAQRIAVPEGQVAPEAVERAVSKSGLYLETLLAKALPTQGDAKAALLDLKAVLEKWLGPQPAATPVQDRAAPPLRGLPPRAAPIEQPALPDTPRDIGRTLHEQTDAAISRVKLGQMAALPDSGAPRQAGPELRLELPLLIGHQLVMAQLQITPDAPRREARSKRGWTMRFAMHFAATGEVGAEIGLLDKSVNVGLWAAEPEVAAAMQASLPELKGVLEELGLNPGAIRVRGAPPEAAKLPAGHLLDTAT